MVGHSSGEIAAAYTAGALNKDSALRVAYFRGQCVSRLQNGKGSDRGGMLAVGLSEQQLEPHLSALLEEGEANALECGCINSPQSTTVTGSEKYIDVLATRLQAAKIFSRKLNVSVAYHSHQMLAIVDEYHSYLDGYLDGHSREHGSLMFSSVTGLAAETSDLTRADYWVTNLISQVKFSQALQVMYSSCHGSQNNQPRPLAYILEVGPHCSLERPVRDTLSKETDFVYDYILHRNVSPSQTVKDMAGRLAIHGFPVDVYAINSQGVSGKQPRLLIDLPKYAFNHSNTYWLESRLSANVRTRETPRHELLGTRSPDWNPLRPTWRIVLRDSDLPWVSDHKVLTRPSARDNYLNWPHAVVLTFSK